MFNWLRRKPKSSEAALTAAHVIVSSVTQANLDVAADKLLQEGPTAALRFLIENADLRDQAVLRRIQAVVFLHRKRIEAEAGPEFLLQTVFDPIFCQCSICQRYWSISPLLASPTIPPEELQPLIAESETKSCPTCGKVYCRRCAATAGKDCTCGALLEPLVRPNGRKPQQPATQLEEASTWLSPRKETPLRSDPDLHLYFGREGKVPIAVDPAFPLSQSATFESHLDWAEALLDAGQYYQAQQQLDLLGAAATQNGHAGWLRARLRWIQFQNLRAISKLHPVLTTREYEKMLDRRDEIHRLLEQACQQAPKDGRIWLTRAQACLDVELGQVDATRAVEFARQARQYMGESPQALYIEGQALYQLNQYEAALVALRNVPSDSAVYAQACQQANLTELALRCQAEPLDIQAHLQLGYWFWRHHRRPAAQPIFEHLMAAEPDCAESLFVQGLLVWFDFQHARRFNLAHQYFRKALEQNPNFGLAYQYLGIIYHSIPSSHEELDFQPGDPLECYQSAVTLDPTCDLALAEQGQLAIDRGDIATAVSLLERAAALDTTDHSVYLNLAAIYLGTRQFEKQDSANQKAKQLEPTMELKAEYVDRILALCNFEY